MIAQYVILHHVAQLHPLDAVVQGDPGAGDGGRARAAVGLDDVPVNADLALAELGQSNDGAEGAANQTLYLLRPPRGVPYRHLAAHAVVGGARQHAVLGRHPTAPLTLEPGGHALFQARRTQDMGIPELNETGTFCVLGNSALNGYAASLVGDAVRRARAAVASLRLLLGKFGPNLRDGPPRFNQNHKLI